MKACTTLVAPPLGVFFLLCGAGCGVGSDEYSGGAPTCAEGADAEGKCDTPGDTATTRCEQQGDAVFNTCLSRSRIPDVRTSPDPETHLFRETR